MTIINLIQILGNKIRARLNGSHQQLISYAKERQRLRNEIYSFISNHKELIYVYHKQIQELESNCKKCEAFLKVLEKERKSSKKRYENDFYEYLEQREAEHMKSHPGLYLDFVDWKRIGASNAAWNKVMATEFQVRLVILEYKLKILNYMSVIDLKFLESSEFKKLATDYMDTLLEEMELVHGSGLYVAPYQDDINGALRLMGEYTGSEFNQKYLSRFQEFQQIAA